MEIIQQTLKTFPGSNGLIRCPLCDKDYRNEDMDLHEVITRGMVYNKINLEFMPTPLHALICKSCHGGHTVGVPHAHSSAGRKLLFEYNIKLWGKPYVSMAVRSFNERLHSPLSPDIVPYELLDAL